MDKDKLLDALKSKIGDDKKTLQVMTEVLRF